MCIITRCNIASAFWDNFKQVFWGEGIFQAMKIPMSTRTSFAERKKNVPFWKHFRTAATKDNCSDSDEIFLMK